MTDRELLKEAMKSFEGIASIPPEMYSNDVWAFKAWAQSRARFMVDRIEQHLADHSPDAGNMVAMELVEKIRDGVPKCMGGDTNGGLTLAVRMTLTDSEAAALIEQYGRRVPREMLEEIERKACRNGDIGGCSCLSLNNIAAKYGVKIEEDGK